MDAEGARELTRRLGANAGLPPRPLPAGVPKSALPLYRWFGGDSEDSEAEPSPPPRRQSLRRRRLR